MSEGAFQIDQMQLVVAITKEVERQYKEAGESPNVPVFRMQSIIEGANVVVSEFARPMIRAVPGMGVSAWLRSDDTGQSSLAMCAAIFGFPSLGDKPRVNHPHDPDDFGRCHRFVLATLADANGNTSDVNAYVAHMNKVRALSPVWQNLIDNWAQLTALYHEELPTGKAPKLYERMKALGC